MQRIAEFLDIRVAPEIWPELVSAASFDAMQRDGPTLVSAVTFLFDTGSQRFFHKGTNERWRGLFREEDLAAYDAKIEARFPPECALWVARGRLEAGDPRLTSL